MIDHLLPGLIALARPTLHLPRTVQMFFFSFFFFRFFFGFYATVHLRAGFPNRIEPYTNTCERETEDYVELVNAGSTAVDLSDFYLSDDLDASKGRPARLTLVSRILAPGERVLVWLDDTDTDLAETVEKGEEEGGSKVVRHMPFKLSSKGDSLLLWYSTVDQHHRQNGGTTQSSAANTVSNTHLVDCWQVPALGENEAFGRFPDGISAPHKCTYGKNKSYVLKPSTAGVFSLIEIP